MLSWWPPVQSGLAVCTWDEDLVEELDADPNPVRPALQHFPDLRWRGLRGRGGEETGVEWAAGGIGGGESGGGGSDHDLVNERPEDEHVEDRDDVRRPLVLWPPPATVSQQPLLATGT